MENPAQFRVEINTSVCRTFKVPRSTLLDTLERVGWTAPAKA